MTSSSDTDKDLPMWLQIILGLVIMFVFSFAFIWLNDNLLHIPLDESSECSGMYEHNCGSVDDLPTDR